MTFVYTQSDCSHEGLVSGQMDDPEKPRFWNILYTMPQHEKKVAIFLERAGIRFYLPQILRKRIWSDRIKWINSPLFPGYLFTAPEDDRDYWKVLQHPGAKLYIFDRGEPARLGPEVVQNIRLMVEQSRDEVFTEPLKRFAIGQKVRVIHGALKGLEGIVDKLRGARQIHILLPLLNTMVSTRIEPDWLEPLEA